MAEMEYNNGVPPPNPLEPAIQLEESSNSNLIDKTVHPQQVPTAEDSAVTKAEKFERHNIADGVGESPSKRRKLDSENGIRGPIRSERQKGVAPIRPESASSIPVSEYSAYDDQVPHTPGWKQRRQSYYYCG